MDTYDIVNIVVLIACALGLRDLWRRIRSGELSTWEIKNYLKQLGILCAAVFILFIVIAGFSESIAPGRITTEGFIRGYIVMMIFLWIMWSIGRGRRDYRDY